MLNVAWAARSTGPELMFITKPETTSLGLKYIETVRDTLSSKPTEGMNRLVV